MTKQQLEEYQKIQEIIRKIKKTKIETNIYIPVLEKAKGENE